MRYAILSDIHANLPALEAVLADIASERIDVRISLGDVVGYGPDPLPTLRRVQESIDVCILGNHDAAIAGKGSSDDFNDFAKRLVRFSARKLHSEEKAILQRFLPEYTAANFRCVHGSPERPLSFNYIHNVASAFHCWKCFSEQLLFVGHTHCPRIFVIGDSRTTYELQPFDFRLEPNKRYIVNPGSVGMPRNDDSRAAYCIYDTETQSITFRQVPFNRQAFRRRVLEANLAPESYWFLDDVEADDPEESNLPPPPEPTNLLPQEEPTSSTKSRLPLWLWATLPFVILLLGSLYAWLQPTPPHEPQLPAPSIIEEVLLPLPETVPWQTNQWRVQGATLPAGGVDFLGDELAIQLPETNGLLRLTSSPFALPQRGFNRIQIKHTLSPSPKGQYYTLILEETLPDAPPRIQEHRFKSGKGQRSKTFNLSVKSRAIRLSLECQTPCELRLSELQLFPKTGH